MSVKTGFIRKEIRGDIHTPISILQKIKGKKKFLLESSHKFNDSGRYSFIGADPAFELISYGDDNEIINRNGEKKTLKGNPLEIVKNLLPLIESDEILIPFIGGAVGYAGYDIIRQYEIIGEEYPNGLNMPDVHLMFYEEIIVYDHLEEKVLIFGIPLSNESNLESVDNKVNQRVAELKRPYDFPEEEPFSLAGFSSDTTKEAFVQNVTAAKEYIVAGDIFQVVLSRRMKSEFQGSTLSLYRKHRSYNPTPYMFYIDFDSYTVIGSSPESLIKTRGRTVIANPIAGTKRRGKKAEEDLQLEKELLQDEKELAEHKMLVDLGRNDLGKVSEFGSVQVERYMAVEKFRHVIHLVSEISGRLQPDKTAIDALAACLPAGTVSGAPKVRAMEIINSLEKSKRGLYSGAIGYLSVNGNMDFALAIRTMILKEGIAYIQAGAGIVFDSNPESEYEETVSKLKSFLEGPKDDFINR
ncbi:anthranilate synthase component I [Neobacillus vireti]|uniref:Anthranilate synthase component 1 n=1 Tax=Neobacillus vireti LMG 21834 TaxID=1131730 RepID=A0AB94ILK9_9BACI|nr:anthranilate synthase component I [Neobacillus vireti]ETI67910.1 anthranilate synthase component I [Neobacillus vireti LMG 21834]KLT17330.1 anthranilate synthase subunit I [Neobacillus vireti]